MKYKVQLLLIVLSLFTLCVSLPGRCASLAQQIFYSGLTISANTEFTGGTYDIRGDFTVTGTTTAPTTLTIQGNTTILVSGNIKVDANSSIVLGGNSQSPLRLKSTTGNITIGGTLNLVGVAGTTGVNGAQMQTGGRGGDGLSATLDIVADLGNITITKPITVVGGVGGRGGNGGGSSGSTDGGVGGEGGIGGAGGAILIFAAEGRVDISAPVKSLGGAGGQGGTGGPDQSIIGGPGKGGKGGTGGTGGQITIAGQDVYLNSGSAFDVSGGAGGVGGSGGTGGSFSSPGPNGDNGTGGIKGSFGVNGGEVYYYTSTTPISTMPGIVTPGDAEKNIQRDTVAPINPQISFPVSQNGEYYTNTTSPTLTIKNPTDGGIAVTFAGYSSTVFKSGISYFTVSITGGTSQNYNYLGTGDANLTLSLPASTTNLYTISVTAVDKYGNRSTASSILLHLDRTAPPIPTLQSPKRQSNGTTYVFSWNPVTDESGIGGYKVFINDVATDVLSTSYSYAGRYNEQVNFYVQAKDAVGNYSQSSAMQTVYTVPQSASISSLTVQGTANAGIQANISFISLGFNVEGYQIMYYQVDYLSNPIGPKMVRQIGPISALEGQLYTHAVFNLEPESKYKFFICTYNKDVVSPAYSSWAAYNTIIDTTRIQVDPATVRTLSGNENWSGTVILTGDVIVPQNITLTVEPGAIVKVPAGRTITINGTIICDGTTAPITFTNVNPLNVARTNVWRGLYLSPTARNNVVKNVIFENANRGLAIEGQNLALNGITFRNSGIGLEVASSTVTINNSRFEGNTLYGIKENNAACIVQVYNNIFLNNAAAPYYSYTKTLLNVNDLNTASTGSGNQ